MSGRAKPTTPAAFVKAVGWATSELGLDDWEIKWSYSPAPPATWGATMDPEHLGVIIPDFTQKTASLWARRTGGDVVATIFHEMLHLSLAEAGLAWDTQDDVTEFTIRRLSSLMVRAYRSGKK